MFNLFKKSVPAAVKAFRQTLAENTADRDGLADIAGRAEGLVKARKQARERVLTDPTDANLQQLITALDDEARLVPVFEKVVVAAKVGTFNRIAERSREPARECLSTCISELETTLEKLILAEREVAESIGLPWEPSSNVRRLDDTVKGLRGNLARLTAEPVDESREARATRVSSVVGSLSEFLGV